MIENNKGLNKEDPRRSKAITRDRLTLRDLLILDRVILKQSMPKITKTRSTTSRTDPLDKSKKPTETHKQIKQNVTGSKELLNKNATESEAEASLSNPESANNPNQLRSYGIRGKQVLSIQMDDDLCDMMSENFNDPDIEFKACANITLRDAYESHKYGAVEIQYEYDHGDSWEHEIIFLGKENKNVRKAMLIPDKLKVVCMAGEGHPCAEDCGGEPGWEDLKKVFKGRKADPRKDWYKDSCANGDPKGLDPYKWDIVEVNGTLAKFFKA
ncbi:hypothetical protein SBOR_7841 [Sclerotinia borealis F-4128]|uniref:Plasmid pRiA4b Orf3-like domain-containing protein n=1 Tax=Sclerotinia borealis (strain F-4128) TaxID=1432307 RepID=W9C7D8_SCLBF|nr:hypothetical protein SBOR_7841 [Sclerotinia borealis F-4128]